MFRYIHISVPIELYMKIDKITPYVPYKNSCVLYFFNFMMYISTTIPGFRKNFYVSFSIKSG